MRLGSLQIACRGLARALVGLHFEGYLLAFLESAQTRALYSGNMDENVFASAVRLNICCGGLSH